MYKNIIINERDKKILKILSKIQVIRSHTLYNLIIDDKKTSLKTFIRRIKKLKDKWYLNDIKWDLLGQQILSLTWKREKLLEIEEIIWSKVYKWNIFTSNSLFTHESYISKSFLFLKKIIEEKTKKELDIDEFISQYYIYDVINWNNKLLDKNLLWRIMINDWMINVWDKISFLIEVEINALNKAKNKFEWYKKMEIYYEKIMEKLDFFKEKVIIFVFCNEYKLERYKNILKEVWLKKFEVKFIALEELDKK
jgi:hypothetical protein